MLHPSSDILMKSNNTRR